MLLRPAKPEEFAVIVELVNQAYRGGAEGAGWTEESSLLGGDRTSLAQLRADLAETPGAELLVLAEGGALVACVWLEPATQGCWYLGMLSVSPNLQDRQLGRTLIDQCAARVKAKGGRTLRITVLNLRDPLLAWYERRGFIRTGKVEPFPYGDEKFGQPRSDDLAFIVLEKPV